ncbi:DNA topoisomerase 3 [Ascoidea rubescens DSM 1968]|uniref:DNA topoisomerase n=1 Tax=Ascoidea rubescens DSM 1968 TaxID=1344418 RepID=A0A1D2VEN5_9ASCO|nr:prokaryotic type I DNA topoisomerase [Ascoidea rubescens DSM 1968]ODV59963.1 prokaryotic type I DNA topoisomerase [Ascoidea rubescens DSM 1968]
MKVLCVAEKNSIALSVARILGGGNVKTRSSTYKYVKNYDFTFDFKDGNGRSNVTMTAVSGHLYSHDFPSQYKSWDTITASKLFEAQIYEKATSDSAKIIQNIIKEAASSLKLMIWTDCDREGEYIGYEIVQSVQRKYPSFSIENTLRAQFSHLEKSHIVRAALNPTKLDKNAVAAVGTRMELDLRTGAIFTRFLTTSYQRNFTDLKAEKRIISYGSCQFPTLGFVVDRYKRVRSFIKEPFWYLDLIIKKGRIQYGFKWSRGHIFDRVYVTALLENCLAFSDKAIVSSIVKKPKINYKPFPLTTVELQKKCSNFFKFSAKDTLSAAESLYTKGFISYPRTETDSFPKKMDLKEFIEKQTQDAKWGSYAKSLLEDHKFCQPRNGKNNDEAHPPIHPVNYLSLSANLNAKEKTIYEYVVRHFLACCSDDGKGDSTTITLKWGTETFTANSIVVRELNYLEVYNYSKWVSTTKMLPELELNEEVPIFKCDIKDGFTAPPSYLTETELISLMDANGIGTDATIAEHIEKIKTREYISEKKVGTIKRLVPSELGMGLVQGFESIDFNNNISLSKPFLRKNLEIELKNICSGTKTKEQVLREMIQLYKEAFQLTTQNCDTLIKVYKDIQSENK